MSLERLSKSTVIGTRKRPYSCSQPAGEQVQQGDPEPKNSDPERGIKVSQLGAFLFAVAAMAALFAVVSRLFITWRNTIRRTT